MCRNKEVSRLIVIFFAIALLSTVVSFSIDTLVGLMNVLSLGAVFVLFYSFTKKRYEELDKLSCLVRSLADGKIKLDVRDHEEGELSILKNEIFKLAERLSEHTSILQQDKKNLKDVLSDISHQLKTPLTSLSVMADLLEDDSLPLEKRHEFLRNIKNGLLRMEWMILSLLKMAKLDAGAIELKTEAVSVGDVIRAAAENVSVLMDIKEQLLCVKGEAIEKILCDKQWTTEALANILKNASEHSPYKSEILLEYGENPICAWLSVSDSGKGIAQKDKPHLFKRFYKSEGADKNSIGIGLPMSLMIMRKQGGDIEAKNREPNGTVFTLKFYK